MHVIKIRFSVFIKIQSIRISIKHHARIRPDFPFSCCRIIFTKPEPSGSWNGKFMNVSPWVPDPMEMQFMFAQLPRRKELQKHYYALRSSFGLSMMICDPDVIKNRWHKTWDTHHVGCCRLVNQKLKISEEKIVNLNDAGRWNYPPHGLSWWYVSRWDWVDGNRYLDGKFLRKLKVSKEWRNLIFCSRFDAFSKFISAPSATKQTHKSQFNCAALLITTLTLLHGCAEDNSLRDMTDDARSDLVCACWGSLMIQIEAINSHYEHDVLTFLLQPLNFHNPSSSAHLGPGSCIIIRNRWHRVCN